MSCQLADSETLKFCLLLGPQAVELDAKRTRSWMESTETNCTTKHQGERCSRRTGLLELPSLLGVALGRRWRCRGADDGTTLKGRAETEKELQRSASPLVDFVGWGMMQKSESKASETKRKGEGYSIILLDHYANRLHFQVGIVALWWCGWILRAFLISLKGMFVIIGWLVMWKTGGYMNKFHSCIKTPWRHVWRSKANIVERIISEA